ncbi:MAG: sulfatase-like hydrolase/transferase [Anaerolineae bacterium]|nr:sulfatase-like hydrolase/transferase [Anaerolineae bacterium]
MPHKPNIVFILADDMGYGDFGMFHPNIHCTPALDNLAGESICFTHQYTASPVCNPSRAALLTGRYPHRTGSIDTLEWHGLERLALREVTLADVLQQAGYRTGLVGKWHLGSFDPRYSPTRRGFDEAVCFRGGMHDYYDWRIEYNDRPVRGDGRYLTDVWTEEAVSFIERQSQEQPFFLHVTYNAPHTPLQVPEEMLQPYLAIPGLSNGAAHVYAMIERMDRGIQRIIESLEKSGFRENTILIFTSDNGPDLSSDGEWSKDRFNCQFHGAKGTVYEGGIRVPLLLSWLAGGLGGGTTFNENAHFTDWFPTLLAMANVPMPDYLDGRMIDGINLFPAISGQKSAENPRRFWQWNRYTPLVECNAAVRDGDWKLVRPAIQEAMQVPDIEWLRVSMYQYEYFLENDIFRTDPDRTVPTPPQPELYNLREDPLETTNLAMRFPNVVSTLTAHLEQWFASVEADRRTILEN